ncbi:MAG: hypothetical protein FWF85_09415 [Clostridiales bacterium]|nr:hypothetical protein [Clostridiales bacterium]
MAIAFRKKYVKYFLYLLAIILLLSSCKTSKNNDLLYLEDHELTYRGLTIGKTTVEELLETLGEPARIDEEKTPERVVLNINYRRVYNYIYDVQSHNSIGLIMLDNWSPYGVNFVFYEGYLTLQRIYISKILDYPTPYGINVGDLIENVLDKLPLKPDMKQNISDHMKSGADYTGLLYGNWSDETGYGSFSIRESGRCVDIELVTPTGLELYIIVRNHLVNQIQIGYYNVAK